jgi:hypothetical protein
MLASVHESPGRPAARVVTAVILAVLAIVLVIIGVIYLAEPSASLPSVLPGHLLPSQTGASKNHPLRGAGCLVLGVIFSGAAWFALSFQPKAPTAAASRPNSPASRH